MSRILPFTTLLLIVAVALPADATQELTPLARDDAGDVQAHPAGAGVDLPQLASLDMKALAIGQTPAGMRFLLDVEDLGPDASTRVVGSADYRIHWTQGDVQYLLVLSRTAPAPPGAANVYDANLDFLHPEHGTYLRLEYGLPVAADETAGTMETVVPWGDLPRNRDGSATLEGLHVTSNSYAGTAVGLVPSPHTVAVRVGDRLPDAGTLQHTTALPEPAAVGASEPARDAPGSGASVSTPSLAPLVVAVGLLGAAVLRGRLH